jgi:MYXO-CTERM domain-containing protein
LLTDGAESCQGDPVAAADELLTNLGVETFVVGFSVLPSEEAQLDGIANAGSVSGTRNAFLVGDQSALANALATIVSDSIVFEVCNGADDDCDTRIDEGFPVGQACDDGLLGACLGTGVEVCNATEDGTDCMITNPGATPGTEVCNGLDDNCNGLVDEMLNCQPGCTPTGPDLCDGLDNDCDNTIDEGDPLIGTPCGQTDAGPCEFGVNACIGGMIECVGEVPPGTEVCNGLDDDCDGVGDDMAMCPNPTSCVDGGCRIPCSGGEFDCPGGFDCVTTADGRFCVPSPCAGCLPTESCVNDACVDLCADVTCAANEQCRLGNCFDCHSLGCPANQVCVASECISDPCDSVDCTTCNDPQGCSCLGGACVGNCDDANCPEGQTCTASGDCAADPCADVSCLADQICVDGTCENDPCVAIACSPGDTCVDGTCIDDPCAVVECSAGRSCEVNRDGEASCVADDPPKRGQPIYAAGGGCQTGPSGGSALLLLGAMLLVLRRRRANPEVG